MTNPEDGKLIENPEYTIVEEKNFEENNKYCTNCGSSINSNAEICPKCGSKSKQDKNTKYCSNCGKTIDINAEICPKCGVRVKQAPSNNSKDPVVAAVLSFFICGLGQIYNGELGKGLILLICYVLCFTFFWLIIPGLIAVVIWIYGIYDAYTVAKELNY
ncbi:zinc-ribbon domain-containing protein [Methanobrevibacter sp. DSM 116169]|uniref:zinc-ribbon domain-containing protein n=1 Tax=Methanobrevibacter sp. DSM 116169 TaxID=3242727 RepID=UPI0038FCCEA6